MKVHVQRTQSRTAVNTRSRSLAPSGNDDLLAIQEIREVFLNSTLIAKAAETEGGL